MQTYLVVCIWWVIVRTDGWQIEGVCSSSSSQHNHIWRKEALGQEGVWWGMKLNCPWLVCRLTAGCVRAALPAVRALQGTGQGTMVWILTNREAPKGHAQVGEKWPHITLRFNGWKTRACLFWSRDQNSSSSGGAIWLAASTEHFIQRWTWNPKPLHFCFFFFQGQLLKGNLNPSFNVSVCPDSSTSTWHKRKW